MSKKKKALCMTSPVGIIVTFSKKMIYDEIGKEKFIGQILTRLNENREAYWMHTMHIKPKHEVIYCYILYDGKIQMRANIAGFEKGYPVIFLNRRTYTPNHWMILTAPVVVAPFDIPMKGFQGFRYCAEMF